MDDVTSFRIEKGSCLESIDPFGLTGMSYLNENEGDRKGILVLPSKVTSIAEDGLVWNNLIKTIYYSGSTHLSNYSRLEYLVSAPDIKVTSSYKYDTIFGSYTPNKDRSSIAEAEEKCKGYGFIPKATPSRSPFATPSRSPYATPSRSPFATPSRSPFASPSRSPFATPSRSPSPTVSSKPTAGYQGRGELLSLLESFSRAWRSGRRGVDSLRRGELQTAESDPVKPQQ